MQLKCKYAKYTRVPLLCHMNWDRCQTCSVFMTPIPQQTVLQPSNWINKWLLGAGISAGLPPNVKSCMIPTGGILVYKDKGLYRQQAYMIIIVLV